MIVISPGWFLARQQAVGIDAVDHLHLLQMVQNWAQKNLTTDWS
jgi:hypothetical protein